MECHRCSGLVALAARLLLLLRGALVSLDCSEPSFQSFAGDRVGRFPSLLGNTSQEVRKIP